LPNRVPQIIVNNVLLPKDADGANLPNNVFPVIILAQVAPPQIVPNGSSNLVLARIAPDIKSVSPVVKILFAAGVWTPILVAKPTTMG